MADSEIKGLFQGDLTIRSAIIAAIEDIKKNPFLIDFIFASINKDPIVANVYSSEIDRAKNFILKTDIPVFLNVRLDDVKFPCVTITLKDSTETEVTLSDTHYQSSEETDISGSIIAGPFSVSNYDVLTGTITIPDSVAESVDIFANMIIQDSNGIDYIIKEMIDINKFKIDKNIVADFRNAIIKLSSPNAIVSLESLNFRETYILGCHVHSEPVNLIYLHSLLIFILLRYKQNLFEARGFERHTIASSDLMKNDNFDNELVYSRYITLTGTVRHYWPKNISVKVAGITIQPLKVIGADKINQGLDTKKQSWIGENDSIG